MDNQITKQQILDRYQEQGLRLAAVPLGGGYEILVTEYGGRIFGPFGPDGVSVLWINGVFRNAEKFADFVEERNWNLGGDRLWFEPELDFFCTSPETFDESYTVPGGMDPGYYAMETEKQDVRLKNKVEMHMPSDGSSKSFLVCRTVRPAANPLKYLRGTSFDVEYCGYYQDIDLEDIPSENGIYPEPWILTQINPGGKVLVPFLGDFEFVDYYEPVDENCQKVYENYAELNITGQRKYKTAYRAANTFGRMAYVNRMASGKLYLMIRNYYNDSSFSYTSGPWREPEDRGCSMYFYNDGGSEGGYGEFENSCMPAGPEPESHISHSTTALWFFFGEAEELEKVIHTLLGITYKIEI
ncbi:MAG TPA: hypothetical protein IAC99_04195 [Candidatus Choladocola avistercoris]|nr:hypothetical protein [Candidatus Choladocola avistercoris]